MQGLTHLSSPELMCLAQEVHLEGNSLTSCAGLSGLLSAQEVNLKGNKVCVIDVELARLSRLTTLNLDGNGILASLTVLCSVWCTGTLIHHPCGYCIEHIHCLFSGNRQQE